MNLRRATRAKTAYPESNCQDQNHREGSDHSPPAKFRDRTWGEPSIDRRASARVAVSLEASQVRPDFRGGLVTKLWVLLQTFQNGFLQLLSDLTIQLPRRNGPLVEDGIA